MNSTRQPSVRRSGRPDAEATERLNRHLLDTATRLFTEQGYAATSMEQIAAAAGAGKQTIYRRYPSKEELFAEVLFELGRSLLEFKPPAEKGCPDPLVALRESCRNLLEFVAQPLPTAMYRILIAEGLRFPSLIERVTKSTFEPFDDAIRHLLEAARNAGQLRADSPIEDLHHALMGGVTGWFTQRQLLGLRAPSTEEERRVFFDNVWALFLNGAVGP
jgi:AcrR family transcriptional regulator